MDDSALQRVEQKRLELAENITKLRKSLNYWQTLEIDYEGLKEEIQLLPEDSTLDARLQAARDFKAEAVDEKELQAIFCSGPSIARPTTNVVDLLTKRVEYVSRNIDSIRKQVTEAEKKRNALLLAEEPDFREDAALPLAEITEQLDDDGNVISNKVQTPGAEATQLLDVLKKAGVDDLREINGTVTQKVAVNNVKHDNMMSEKESDASIVPETRDTSRLQQDDVSAKSVEPEIEVEENVIPQPPRPEVSLTSDSSNPNDTPEEAVLRREMLNYGLDEVGAIVAELDLEEDASDVSYDEDDLEFEIGDDDEEQGSESEDETGKSKNLNLSAGYRRQMEELEKKLGLKDMKNLGPEPDLSSIGYPKPDRPTAAEAARRAAIARHEAALRDSNRGTAKSSKEVSNKSQKKKKVAFAESLDIADESSKSSAPIIEKTEPSTPSVPTIEETIIERVPESNEANAPPPAPAPLPSKKISKFKPARSAMPQTPLVPPPMTFPSTTPTTTPEGPKGKVIADALVEHNPSDNTSPPTAPDDDDFNEQIQKQELAKEYYRQRNNKIRQQGGFVHGGEEDNYGDDVAFHPVEDEETGKSRKLSRFMAARIKS